MGERCGKWEIPVESKERLELEAFTRARSALEMTDVTLYDDRKSGQ